MVVRVTLTDDAPAGTNTVAGTGATAELVLVNAIVAPSAGARETRVTISAMRCPPVSVLLLKATAATPEGGVIFKDAVRVTPEAVAVRNAVASAAGL